MEWIKSHIEWVFGLLVAALGWLGHALVRSTMEVTQVRSRLDALEKLDWKTVPTEGVISELLRQIEHEANNRRQLGTSLGEADGKISSRCDTAVFSIHARITEHKRDMEAKLLRVQGDVLDHLKDSGIHAGPDWRLELAKRLDRMETERDKRLDRIEAAIVALVDRR